ncbi:MAG TPA: prepilin-type N-terminal cleavage/methylation domain-containing protein [Flavobacterium sp.]|jgi:type II secretory pathway component PulJ
MKKSKISSFTLSELLVVMIITAIVVGIAFSVLRLVQTQINGISKNYEKTATLALFEQALWQDFNRAEHAKFDKSVNKLTLESGTDTALYVFHKNWILRNTDTLKLTVVPVHWFFNGNLVHDGLIDAIEISADAERRGHDIFVWRRNDGALLMNNDGI